MRELKILVVDDEESVMTHLQENWNAEMATEKIRTQIVDLDDSYYSDCVSHFKLDFESVICSWCPSLRNLGPQYLDEKGKDLGEGTFDVVYIDRRFDNKNGESVDDDERILILLGLIRSTSVKIVYTQFDVALHHWKLEHLGAWDIVYKSQRSGVLAEDDELARDGFGGIVASTVTGLYTYSLGYHKPSPFPSPNSEEWTEAQHKNPAPLESMSEPCWVAYQLDDQGGWSLLKSDVNLFSLYRWLEDKFPEIDLRRICIRRFFER